ncbi:hypothetical protein [Silanimonas lenta]|jgi:TPR repeat protein|uniref:hypothetical protein n=1 Tax=Silanimonas lenta TaxID=265429 RepID=UPI0012EC3D63|nr:hypothetical protein [Silanimonas lenta]
MNRLTIAALVFLLSASTQVFAEGGEKPVDISHQFEIEESNLNSKVESALNGSPQDALDVFWFYLDRGNKDEALYWSRVAMENGSDLGRKNYASLLLERCDQRSVARARFHLRILVNQGNEDAQVLLNKLNAELRPPAGHGNQACPDAPPGD